MNWRGSPDLFGLTVATSKAAGAGDEASCGAAATTAAATAATAPITHGTSKGLFIPSFYRSVHGDSWLADCEIDIARAACPAGRAG